MPLPNFLVIGAAKSGTSAFYDHLHQHPEIFMPAIKEPRFWGLEGHVHDWQGPDKGMNRSISDMKEYLALFEGAEGYKAIGEASPILGSPTAPAMLREHIPHAKLMAILRHPAERAFSSYCHMVRDGHEPYTFERGLEEEEARRKAKWSPLFWYKELGLYGRDLKRWREHFPKDQFRVYLYDDFRAGPMEVVRDAFRFLGVDPGFQPVLDEVNVSGIPRSRLVFDLFRKDNTVKTLLKPFFPRAVREGIQAGMLKYNIGPKPKLRPDTRRMLTEHFRDDILLLQDLLERDLSIWLRERADRSGSGHRTAAQPPG